MARLMAFSHGNPPEESGTLPDYKKGMKDVESRPPSLYLYKSSCKFPRKYQGLRDGTCGKVVKKVF